MKIVSIQIGKSRPITVVDRAGVVREMHTGIFKTPVAGPHFLGRLGIRGDEHVNKPFHGGEGRALYIVSKKAYDLWSSHLSSDLLRPGLLGENVTLDELDEYAIRVGDTFTLGGTRLQATMPRIPCPIMEAKLRKPGAMELIHDLGLPGVLFRVLREGSIEVGDELRAESTGSTAVTMAEFMNMFRLKGMISRADYGRLCETPHLPDGFLALVKNRILPL